jgi:hypothetical protein
MFKQTDDDRRIARIAAMMAVSNCGHGVDVAKVTRPIDHNSPYPITARNEVEYLAGHLIETDEHETMFANEATSWAKEIKKTGGLRPFAARFPHHADTIRAVMEL